MNDTITSESKWARRARPVVSWGLLVAAGAAGWGVADSVASFFNSVRVQLNDSAVCCESFRSYRDEDSGQRVFWVGIIESLRAKDTAYEKHLSDLATRLSVVEARLDERSAAQSILSRDVLPRIEERLDKLERSAGQ